MGERSIAGLINERKLLDPDVSYTILTDNKKDLNKIQALLDDENTEIRLVLEFASDLSNKGILSADDFLKFDAPSFSAPRQAGFISPELLIGDLSPRQLGRMGGMAFTGVDTLLTARDANQFLAQDNATAAREQWMRFGASNGAAWGGAILTAEAMGATTAGPLTLVALDAILLAKAGDKAVSVWQNEKIYTQEDRKEPGVTYTYDGRDWIRKDLRADRVDDGIDDFQLARFRAPPEKAQQLSYQASVEAAEQALGHVPTPRNPFVQPVSENDPAHLHTQRWTYSPESERWSRMVADDVDRNGAPEWKAEPEYASPERTAQLNALAVQTIDANLQAGPAAIAMQYQIGHKAYGYDQIGAEPVAVTSAMTADRLQASDERLYERDAQGTWRHGSEPASAPRALELDLTRARLLVGMEAHTQEMARIPEWTPPTPEQLDRAQLHRLYADAGRNPDVRPEEFEAAYAAVQRTRVKHGLIPGVNALEPEPATAGKTIAEIEIRHTRFADAAQTKVEIAAVTTPNDIAAELSALKSQGPHDPTPTHATPEQKIA